MLHYTYTLNEVFATFTLVIRDARITLLRVLLCHAVEHFMYGSALLLQVQCVSIDAFMGVCSGQTYQSVFDSVSL